MSEDYKKIALEDVKKGQRVQIALYHATHVASYTGTVVSIEPYWKVIALGYDLDEFHVCLTEEEMPDIFLLEDAPKPKVVRTETVTVTHYDDGTKTETPVKEEVKVPMVIKTMAQFEEHEEYLKKTVLRDKDGDYLMYRDGHWCWTNRVAGSLVDWIPTRVTAYIEENRPMTIVENVGD